MSFDMDSIKNLNIENMLIILVPVFFLLMFFLRFLAGKLRLLIVSFIVSMLIPVLSSDKLPEPLIKFLQIKHGAKNVKVLER